MSRSITVTDLKRICRICLAQKNMMKSISPMIIYMLETCTSVQETSNEKIPRQICTDCYIQLKNAFNFKQRCLVTSRILSEIIFQSENHVQKQTNRGIIIIKTEYVSDDESDIKKEILNDTTPRGKEEKENENTINSLSPQSNNCERIREKDKNTNLTPDEIFHKIYRNNIVPTIVTCNICGKKIRWRYLRRHQKCHSDNKPYECDICHVRYKRSFELNKHKRIVHSTGNDGKELCFICGKLVLPPLSSHLQMHTELNAHEQFKCDKCDKSYRREDCLRMHVRAKHSADGIRTYTCPICHKTLITSLKIHMKYVHSDVKREHACKCCSKTYRNKANLTWHVRKVHLNVRPHSCTICERAFHTRQILVNHMRTHNGERPFTCHICGKTFSFSAALRTHMKVHKK